MAYSDSLILSMKIIPAIAVVVVILVFSSVSARQSITDVVPGRGIYPLFCWDRNHDGQCNLPTEDVWPPANGTTPAGDGKCDWRDCQGPQGPAGADGPPGPPGPAGESAFPYVPCNTTSDCETSEATCTVNLCINSTCHYYLPEGFCTLDSHCNNSESCINCHCVETCTNSTCVSDECTIRTCVLGACTNLTRDDGCCLTAEDCGHNNENYYSFSGLFANSIDSRNANISIEIEGVTVKDGNLTVPGGFYSYMPGLFNNGINSDTIGPYTPGSNVTMLGATFQSGGIETLTSLYVENITATGLVDIQGTLALTGTLNVPNIETDSITSRVSNTDLVLSGSGTGVVVISDSLNVDSITSKTTDTDLDLSGSGTGVVAVSDSLKVNTIIPFSGGTVTAGGVALSSGSLSATSGSFSSTVSTVTLTASGAATASTITATSASASSISTSGGVSATGNVQTAGLRLTGSTGTSVMDRYEEYVANITLSGVFSASKLMTISLVLVGKSVTLSWKGYQETLSDLSACSSTPTISSAFAIPSRFSVGTVTDYQAWFTVPIIDNGITFPSIMAIYNTGTINWFAGYVPTGSPFSCLNNTGDTGLPPGSISWYQGFNS